MSAPARGPSDARLHVLRDALLALIQRGRRDLTTRQLSTLMVVYGSDEVQTVGSLAELMHISRSVVTRTVNDLAGLDLLSRQQDPNDRRRIVARRTAAGLAFYHEIWSLVRGATADSPDEMPPTGRLN